MIFVKSARLWLLFALAALCLAAPLHAVNRGTGDSGDSSKSTDDSKDFDPDGNSGEKSEPGDHDQRNCSIVYRMNIGGAQSERGLGVTNLVIKRLKPTPAIFTPQSIEVDSRMAQEVVEAVEAEESIASRMADQALATAEASLQAATDANDAAALAEAAAAAAVTQAEQDLADAQSALAADPEDTDLQQAVEDAEAALAAANAEHTAAATALDQSEQDLAAAEAAKVAAESDRDAAAADLNAFITAHETAGTLLLNEEDRPLEQVTMVRPSGELIRYRPNIQEGVWAPAADEVGYSSRLRVIDSKEIERIGGRGSFFAGTAQVGSTASFITPSGRQISAVDPGVRHEIIRRDGGLRQVVTAQAFTDVVVLGDLGYEVRLYEPDAKGNKNAEGLYEPQGTPFASFTVENATGDPARNDHVRITTVKGGRSQIAEWRYTEGANAWEMTDAPGDDAVRVNKTIQDIAGGELHEWRTFDADSNLVGVRQETVSNLPWGQWMTKRVIDPDGANLIFTREFHDNSSESGKYGKVKTEVNPDGSWVSKDYDSEGRETVRIEPWLDAAPGSVAAQAKATYFDYTPVDPNDSSLEYDLRPRTETVKILGDITKKTFYAYYENASDEFVEIIEMAATPNASYGDSDNLRRTKTHYAETADEESAGRLKTEEHPDGRLTTYAYERLADDTFVTTVTRGVIESPDGVANKTTQEVTTLDPEGNVILRETYVYTGGTNYDLIETVEIDYNERNQITERRRNGRILYSATYQDGLRASKTDEQGITTAYTYDEHERVKTETKLGIASQADITTTYTYDGEDRILKKEIEGGSLKLVEEWTYDLAGRMTAYRDQNGYLTTYLYENDGRKVTRTNSDTGVVVTERFRDGRIKSVSGNGTVDEYYAYTVNANGSITTDKTAGRSDSSRVLTTTKDILNRTVERRRPGFGGNDFVINYEYDGEGYLVKQTETEKADTLFVYNTARQLFRSGLDLDANGVLDLASDDRINETDESFYEDSSEYWWRSAKELVYDESSVGTPTLVKETRRRIDGFASGEASQTLIIDTSGNQTDITATIDRAMATMVVTTERPESSQPAIETYLNGLLQSRTSETVAEPTTFTYDALARRKTVKQPRHTQAAVIEYRRHLDGISINPSAPAQLEETTSNLVATQTDAAGNTTKYLYYDNGEQGAGRVRQTENALGDLTYNSYDLLGNRVQTWGEATYPVEFTYNEFNEQVTMTTYRSGDDQNLWTQSTWPASPPTGDTTTWTYDEATGLLTAKTDAKGEAVTYDYTTAGRMSDRFWARLDTQGEPLQTSYAYDPLTGERTLVDYADSTPDITYALDRAGRLETVTDATGSRTFAYRDDLQTESETIASFYGTDKRITRGYETGTPGTDVVGRYTGFQVGTAADTDADYAVAYGFDAQGRLDSVTDPSQTFTYSYLADSNLIESMTSPVHSTTYTYEDERNVKTVVDNVVNSLSVSKYGYEYDELGRRTSRVQEGSAFTQASFDAFDYNDRSEVTGSDRYLGTDITDLSSPVTSDTFAYDFDPIGNRIESSTGSLAVTDYTTNELNQYTQVTGLSAQPSHDPDGNLTEQGSWVYKWNAENRLIEAYSFTEDKKLEFLYDYLGRRVEKKVSVLSTSTVISEERFLYDAWNLVAVYNPADGDTLVKTHTWGLDLSQSLQGAGGVGGLLGVEELTGSHQGLYAFAFDVNGNVSEVLAAAGAIAAHYEYSPFGEVIRSTGTYADANTFRFSTKYLDVETDLYYYGFRYYDPATGRWLNRDPLQERGGINMYAFVQNYVTDAYDYLGLATQIQIGYTNTPVPGTNHALVIATDTNTGEQYASRAGPEAQGPSGSASESSQSTSGGSASASSGNGSSGGFGFGQIDAQSGPYNEDFRDPPSAVHTVQNVGTIDRDFSDVVSNMQEFESVTDSNQIPYSPLGPNSNSYAFTLTESLTGERPEPDINAPGWRDGQPDEDLTYDPADFVQCSN